MKTKNTWNYEISLRQDAEFLPPEEPEVETEKPDISGHFLYKAEENAR